MGYVYMYSEGDRQLLTRYILSGSVIIRQQLRLVLDEINIETYFVFLSVMRSNVPVLKYKMHELSIKK
jgi:hypothetical protein